jgi:prepilin-type N-terminal cleavage/methylation domain-containing protein
MTQPYSHPTSKKVGFTLLELLIAISIMSMIFATCYLAFSSTLNAWRRGSEYLEKQHHSEYVQGQILSALRSAVFSPDSTLNYGFWHTDHISDGIPNDEISWVTASSAFASEPLTYAPHRLYLNVDHSLDEPALAAKVHFHFANEDEMEKAEYQTISRGINGINCRFYDAMNEEWDDQWESTNTIPRQVEITLYAPPADEGEEPITFTRIIRIPVAE